MTAPNQYGKAEEFAVEAVKYLGQAGGPETAAVWAALAQVHATLAVAGRGPTVVRYLDRSV